MEDLRQYLRNCGIKVTKSRISILKILSSSDSSISADDIFKEFEEKDINIDMSTIYRTLELFEKKRIIKKFDIGINKATYAILKKHHKHIVQCKFCHKQVEIDCPMQEIEEVIKSKTGFILVDENLNLRFNGICSQCRDKLSKPK